MKPAIIHHTGGTNANPLADTSHHTFKIVDDYHRKKWNFKSTLGHYIGYHYFIEKDGSLFQGRQHDELGAHTFGFNDHIGICLAGNFDFTKPTAEQTVALRKLLNKLYRDGEINAAKPHRIYAAKSCYGKRLPNDWAENLIQKDSIKLSVVTDKERDFEKVIKWYEDIGIYIDLDVQVVEFNPLWVEEQVEVYEIDKTYTDTKLAHYASGADILAVVVSKNNWKRAGANGYMNARKSLGLWRCFVQDTERARKYFNSNLEEVPQYVSTLIHEVAHVIYRECGVYDRTHELDQEGNLNKLVAPIHQFIGWNINGGVRLFKVVDGQIKEKIVYERQWSMYSSGLNYWRLVGKYSDIIPLIP